MIREAMRLGSGQGWRQCSATGHTADLIVYSSGSPTLCSPCTPTKTSAACAAAMPLSRSVGSASQQTARSRRPSGAVCRQPLQARMSSAAFSSWRSGLLRRWNTTRSSTSVLPLLLLLGSGGPPGNAATAAASAACMAACAAASLAAGSCCPG